MCSTASFQSHHMYLSSVTPNSGHTMLGATHIHIRTESCLRLHPMTTAHAIMDFPLPLVGARISVCQQMDTTQDTHLKPTINSAPGKMAANGLVAPKLEHLVLPSRRHPRSIRAPVHSEHFVGMAREFDFGLAGADVPDLCVTSSNAQFERGDAQTVTSLDLSDEQCR